MIIVADTSPPNYLVQIKHIDVLRDLYQQIAIPSGVRVELRRDKAPEDVRIWANNLPDWVVVYTDVGRWPTHPSPQIWVPDSSRRCLS